MKGLLPVLAFYSLLHASSSNWMYLGIASLGASDLGPVPLPPGTPSTGCQSLQGLVLEQLKMCRNNPQAMPCVSLGAGLGIKECQQQFRKERWNCTITLNQSVFGPVLSKGTKETAFIYAVTTAGVMHAVTSYCSAGNLTDCSCDMSREGQKGDITGKWKWGGCSDDVSYGEAFSKTFVDAVDKTKYDVTKDIRNLVNLHNNKVGRNAVRSKMMLKCRCHGVSGSCAVKTCWRAMQPFRVIGGFLKQRYENSVAVTRRSNEKLRRRAKRMRKLEISEDELVHLHRSPNYCRSDPRRGVLGTRGRQCAKDRGAKDSCDSLCCGRGYNTQVVRYVERCHCKFVWCCHVKCRMCETVIDRHTCK